MAERDYQYHVWYTRHAGEVSGPFPIGMVRRFVLLGRLHSNDEVSPDKEYWRPIKDVPEVIPEEMRGVKTDEDRMRLQLAQIHEDDRGLERELGDSKPYLGRRNPDERLSPEMEEVIARREAREAIEGKKGQGKSVLLSIVFITTLLALLVWGGLFVYTRVPENQVKKLQCDAPPVPGVNWSHCKKEGVVLTGKKLDGAILNSTEMQGANLRGSSFKNADLSYVILSTADLSYTDFHKAKLVGAGLRSADLSYARLSGADLSFADLRFANLGGASLEGAKLDNAIWVDGSVCAEGSLGNCVIVQ
ncbi:MAG: pentapeptide repeat-containing protein [Gammaproteobacteria bacterium]|nr:pentapeptide repeat-containing protein [Gammaproteobacteria bacterium]